MNILILEDFDYRQKFLKEKFESEDIDSTKDADEGLELLAKNKYDVVFLDHDLLSVAKSGSYLTKRWYRHTTGH